MIEYRVLGPIEALVDGRPAAITAGKQRALLALLLVHANQVVSTDVLIDGLWGARPPATVTKNLQVLVSQLRKTLGENAISTAPGGYRLQVDAAATDADRYELLLERGRRELAEGRPRVAQRTLEDALGLWRGRALSEVSYEDFARPRSSGWRSGGWPAWRNGSRRCWPTAATPTRSPSWSDSPRSTRPVSTRRRC